MQTKKGSATEALLNTSIGWIINYGANLIVLPLFGFPVTMLQAFWMGIIFTVISIVRGYVLRRWFNNMKWGNNESSDLRRT